MTVLQGQRVRRSDGVGILRSWRGFAFWTNGRAGGWTPDRSPIGEDGTMTLYAALIYTADVDWSAPEYASQLAEWDRFRSEAGPRYVGGNALRPTSTATVVRVRGARGGEIVASDGPYAETKEALTGFVLLDCADQAEAIALAAEIPAAWRGAVEVRPVIPGIRTDP
ncbi:YciI family protein [Streptomyces sp. NRRL WC-3742]|uniref:YciI family protein n=1 Tax=Streptomyces sp. NRRL WC-3742 TaxID=1463934 RepID=UPI002D21C228|nr:YciI family protein [Streptomyces sp. NRRL WC-3742]